MRRSARLFTLLAVVLAAACYPPEAVVDMEAETAALRAVAEAYHEVAASADADAMVDLYAPDCIMYPPGAPVVEGLDGVRAFGEAFMSVPGIQIELEITEVVVSAGGHMGYTMGIGDITSGGPDGEPVVETIRDFHVWTKNADGEWKLVIDIWNSPTPVVEGEHS